jgi:hypothetical protein
VLNLPDGIQGSQVAARLTVGMFRMDAHIITSTNQYARTALELVSDLLPQKGQMARLTTQVRAIQVTGVVYYWMVRISQVECRIDEIGSGG